MDLTMMQSITLDWEFFSGLLSVIIVNVILSGDNAVVLAMAVRSLPRHLRRRGIIIGAAGDVLIRIVLTFFVARMLQAPYVKLAGGLLIVGLAVKLFVDTTPEEDPERQATTIWQALKIIILADITMSLDNMLGVGAASKGNPALLIFGLATSTPLMIFASNLVSIFMDKYPIILYIGAAILGKVGGEMILTDPAFIRWLRPNDILMYALEGLFAVGVIVVGKAWVQWRHKSLYPVEE